MKILVDTNILLRWVQVDHPSHASAIESHRTLTARGDLLHIVPQVAYEFWAVCTRPGPENGLGISVQEADRMLKSFGQLFDELPEHQDTRRVWQQLALETQAKGKTSHDARLAAAAKCHGLDAVLTFNPQHFSRFPGLQILDPADLASQA